MTSPSPTPAPCFVWQLWPEFSPYGEYDLAAPPVAHLFGEAATATAAYYAAAANATGTETEFWGSMWCTLGRARVRSCVRAGVCVCVFASTSLTV